ncbi:hypothetical protein [Bartonella pachyuromydis]|uniref:hypothetical protein n=1 Tax=Bartonella pachyuromydis TaxID=931097 RepID=UPI0031E71B28
MECRGPVNGAGVWSSCKKCREIEYHRVVNSYASYKDTFSHSITAFLDGVKSFRENYKLSWISPIFTLMKLKTRKCSNNVPDPNMVLSLVVRVVGMVVCLSGCSLFILFVLC